MADDSKVSKKSIGKFFKDMRSELKKVIWPDKKQLFNNTSTVLLYCLVIGAIIWSADEILTIVTERFLLK